MKKKAIILIGILLISFNLYDKCRRKLQPDDRTESMFGR